LALLQHLVLKAGRQIDNPSFLSVLLQELEAFFVGGMGRRGDAADPMEESEPLEEKRRSEMTSY